LVNWLSWALASSSVAKRLITVPSRCMTVQVSPGYSRRKLRPTLRLGGYHRYGAAALRLFRRERFLIREVERDALAIETKPGVVGYPGRLGEVSVDAVVATR
jgi:hypothetical protein